MKVLIASNNLGKVKEHKELLEELGLEVLAPKDYGLNIDVIEHGSTFNENAALKVEAFLPYVDDDTYVIGDDGGLEIRSLDNKPGVYTRRWAGYEMTDEQLVDYCLDQMKGLVGEDRKAVFKTVLAVGHKGDDIEYFTGELEGYITEKADPRPVINGLPFRNIFYAPTIGKLLYDIDDHGAEIKSHRQIASEKVFNYLVAKNSNSL